MPEQSYTRETHPHYAGYADDGCPVCRKVIGSEPFIIVNDGSGKDPIPQAYHPGCVTPWERPDGDPEGDPFRLDD